MLTSLSGPQLAAIAVLVMALWRAVAWLRRRCLLAVLSGRPRVIDGDTIVVRGERVRIAGIDAPESAQRFQGQIFVRGPGTPATDKLRRVIAGRPVQVEPIQRDRYGRLVAHVRTGEIDVGAEMIARGYAVAYATGDRRYCGLECQARAEGHGLWARGFERPADFRRRQRGRLFPIWRF